MPSVLKTNMAMLPKVDGIRNNTIIRISIKISYFFA